MLEDTIKEIKVATVAAQEDVLSGNINTLAARRGRQARAVEELKDLEDRYVSELLVTSAFILVTGPFKSSFSNIAIEKYKCFSYDPETFYKELAQKIPEVVYKGKNFDSNVFSVLANHLEDMANKMGLVSFPMVLFNEKYLKVLNTQEELIVSIKQAVNDQMGSEIVGIHAIKSLLAEAIKKEHSGKITPIVLNLNDETLALTLAKDLPRVSRHVSLVSAGKPSKAMKGASDLLLLKDVTEESVQQALVTIKENIKR